MVSHEFRTPLTSIQGVHYLLSKKVAQLPVEQANGMEKLLGLQSEALRNLKELVDQVLLLNRLEHSAPGEPLPQVGVADFFSKLIEGLNVSVAHQRIVLELELPESFTAGFDVAKMRAACENLIANGLKYSAEDTKVRVKVRLAPQGWGFSVADCGRGIPEADQAKLFQPFHRASNVQGVAGTGLGLAIVRRVVDHHGGSISFTTALGKGSEFLLVFPSPQPPAPDSVAISPVLESGAPNLPIATTRFPF
jgi:signal transduction histidine kinase